MENKPISITTAIATHLVGKPLHEAHLYREDGKYVAYFKYSGKVFATKVYEHQSLDDVTAALDAWAIALNRSYERIFSC